LKASDCELPGIIGWYGSNAISNGMPFNYCPLRPIAVPATPTPPAPPPSAVVDPPPSIPEEAPPVAQDASPTPEPSSPVVVVAPQPPPPPQRIPVAVPTYAPWSATAGPGSNAVGSGNGTASYNNPYNTVSPSARAAVNRSDWCNRDGRSQSVASSCIKSVGGR
jgi:outer membrane biosynthesis protein TonB